MSKDEAFLKIITECHDLLEARCHKCVNSVLTAEDIYQELVTYLWIRLVSLDADGQRDVASGSRAVSYLDDPKFSLIGWSRKIIHDRSVDLIRFYSRRTDTSVFHPIVGETMELFLAEHTMSPLDDVEHNHMLASVVIRLRKVEDRLPGIVMFFREAMAPSEVTWQLYDRYESKLKRATTRPDKFAIPPATLAQLLGIPGNRLKSYQREIGLILADLGVRARANPA